MAFMCRPSPVFIEIAQKIVVWNGTWASNDGTFATSYETRGKAWGIRSLAHAIFLTPDGDAWKQAGRSALFRNAQLLKTFQDDSNRCSAYTQRRSVLPVVLLGRFGRRRRAQSRWRRCGVVQGYE